MPSMSCQHSGCSGGLWPGLGPPHPPWDPWFLSVTVLIPPTRPCGGRKKPPQGVPGRAELQQVWGGSGPGHCFPLPPGRRTRLSGTPRRRMPLTQRTGHPATARIHSPSISSPFPKPLLSEQNEFPPALPLNTFSSLGQKKKSARTPFPVL